MPDDDIAEWLDQQRLEQLSLADLLDELHRLLAEPRPRSRWDMPPARMDRPVRTVDSPTVRALLGDIPKGVR